MTQDDREWLKQNVNPPNAETDWQLQKLQKFMDDRADETTSSNEKNGASHSVSRSQRKQRLRQNAWRQSAWGKAQPVTSFPEPLANQALAVPPLPLLQDTPELAVSQTQTPKQLNQQVKGSMPKKKDEYQEWLKQDFGNLFETLDLKDRQRHYLRSRWLDQVLWMEGRAGRARDLHYKLRLTTILGGVIIPALVSLNFVDNSNKELKQALAFSTFVLSQVVAISAASEQFFNHGERWRHYRRGVESLKTQGWQFFELSGPYQPFKTHEEAFPTFSGQVEDVLQRDVEVYSTQVTQPKKDDEKKDEAQNPNGRVPEATRQPPPIPQRP